MLAVHPRFVRIVTSLPVTATDKIDKRPLRSAKWDTPDPVWLRADRNDQYSLMTRADMDRLRAEFDGHGRLDLLGQ